MSIFTDQMGHQVEVPDQLQRIISLVPSQTELLYDLGLGERVVGITKFCIHPETLVQDQASHGRHQEGGHGESTGLEA